MTIFCDFIIALFTALYLKWYVMYLLTQLKYKRPRLRIAVFINICIFLSQHRACSIYNWHLICDFGIVELKQRQTMELLAQKGSSEKSKLGMKIHLAKICVRSLRNGMVLHTVDLYFWNATLVFKNLKVWYFDI